MRAVAARQPSPGDHAGGRSSARSGTRGTPNPTYVWQSTGGTDDFEAKFSLTPLIYGTLKGTFYALLFAVPLALLAAVYVSEFMHPSIKAYVKPIVEIMAALPSVVLGFLAGLWLAPVVERIVPGLFLIPLVLPCRDPRRPARLAGGARRAPRPAPAGERGDPAGRPWSWPASGSALALGGLDRRTLLSAVTTGPGSSRSSA